jgi:hypothetical protein
MTGGRETPARSSSAASVSASQSPPVRGVAGAQIHDLALAEFSHRTEQQPGEQVTKT